MIGDDDEGMCCTCVWWGEASPPLATALINNLAKRDVGTCEVEPPRILMVMGVPCSMYPETHASRGCSAWRGIVGDPGGGEEVPSSVVVPFRQERKAA